MFFVRLTQVANMDGMLSVPLSAWLASRYSSEMRGTVPRKHIAPLFLCWSCVARGAASGVGERWRGEEPRNEQGGWIMCARARHGGAEMAGQAGPLASAGLQG
jgi:hypothetical protein